MKLRDIHTNAVDEVTAGGALKKYTPDGTVWNFMKTGFSEISTYFPLSKVTTVGYSAQYVDLPASDAVVSVIDVVALEGESEEFQYTAEELFFSTTKFIDFNKDLTNWILFQQNLRAYKVLTGAQFDWEQSEQDANRVYLDDVPNGCKGFTIKYTVDHEFGSTIPEEDDEENINLPEPQASYLHRWTVAKLKQSEGAIFKRFRPTGQAAETDGSELASGGKRELEELRQEIKQQGYSTLSI